MMLVVGNKSNTFLISPETKVISAMDMMPSSMMMMMMMIHDAQMLDLVHTSEAQRTTGAGAGLVWW